MGKSSKGPEINILLFSWPPIQLKLKIFLRKGMEMLNQIERNQGSSLEDKRKIYARSVCLVEHQNKLVYVETFDLKVM